MEKLTPEQIYEAYRKANPNLHPAMDLRDYFATHALQGMLAEPSIQASKKVFAEHAYELADAMLAARQK